MQTFLITTFAARFVDAFGAMLVHSLWQGLLLAVVAAGTLMLAKKWNAERKYNLLLLTGIIFLIGCFITFLCQWNDDAGNAAVPFADSARPVAALFFGKFLSIQQILQVCKEYVVAHRQLLFAGWVIIVLYKMLRVAVALACNQRMRSQRVYEPDAYWKERIVWLSEKMKIKKAVLLLQSGYSKMPQVTGHLKPIILIPVGLMAGLPADQLEVILLHELAHIKRCDYLVNIVQHLVETLFFFNPGVWWISSLLREERENCCDDMALSQTQNKRGLAEALISFKEFELYVPAYATAFPGRKKLLLKRIARIMGIKNTAVSGGEKLFFISAVVLLFFTASLVMVGQMRKDTKPLAQAVKAGNTIFQLPVPVIQKTVTFENPVFKQRKAVHIKISEPITRVREENELMETEGAADNNTEQELNLQRAEQDRQAADQVRDQAMLDQKQAMLDQQQALRDQQMAMIDQARAKKDQDQAKANQQNAAKDQERAKIDLLQAKRDQEQAMFARQLMLKEKKDAEKMALKTASFK